jgi:8-oxo-dGTP pyrophosphatase MutT (NUDIX family)
MSEIYPLPLTRAEEARKKPLRLVRAAVRIAVLAQQGKDRTCLFVRHQTKGFELPGGAMEAGEKPQQTGLRELVEEAGIGLPADHCLILIDMIPVIDHRGGNWLDIIYGTVATPLQLIARQEAELPVCWLNAEEIEDQVDQQLSSYSATLKALRGSELWTNQGR